MFKPNLVLRIGYSQQRIQVGFSAMMPLMANGINRTRAPSGFTVS